MGDTFRSIHHSDLARVAQWLPQVVGVTFLGYDLVVAEPTKRTHVPGSKVNILMAVFGTRCQYDGCSAMVSSVVQPYG